MVERAFYSEHPPRAEYRLTHKGREFGAVVRAMYAWGKKHEPRRRPAGKSAALRTKAP